MSCIYIKLKDINKVVLYFDSLRIFHGLIWIKSVKTYMWLEQLQDKRANKITQKKDKNVIKQYKTNFLYTS